eukprot:11692961-Alexandrium_andersonii.AAC.1
MRGRSPAAPQPRARFPPRVQAPAHVARPHTVMHLLAEIVPVVPAGFSEKPLKRSPAVVANEVLGEELPGMLYEPEHYRV